MKKITITLSLLFFIGGIACQTSNNATDPITDPEPDLSYHKAVENASFTATTNLGTETFTHENSSETVGINAFFHIQYSDYTHFEFVESSEGTGFTHRIECDGSCTKVAKINLTTPVWENSFASETGNVSWLQNYSCGLTNTDESLESLYFGAIDSSYRGRYCSVIFNITGFQNFGLGESSSYSKNDYYALFSGTASVVFYEEDGEEMANSDFTFVDYPIRVMPLSE